MTAPGTVLRLIDSATGEVTKHESVVIIPRRAHFELAASMLTHDTYYGADDPEDLAERVCDLTEALGFAMAERYGHDDRFDEDLCADSSQSADEDEDE